MNDSTPFLDADGIRRDRPVVPRRHIIDDAGLYVLGLLANLGEPGSVQRQGWSNLLQVHGFASVMRATARCYHSIDDSEKVTNDQAQAVLDCKRIGGHAVKRPRTNRRRSQVA